MNATNRIWPPPGVSGFLFGGDYNPEQWSAEMGYDQEAIWQEDMRLMRAANVNVAAVGIFSWVSLQPGPDAFNYDWLDRIMDLLAENGIAAVLGTATAAQPAWLSQAHPDVLPVDASGRQRGHGMRMNFCPTSKTFRALAQALVRRTAERYRDHPALALWHVSNEYGPSCYCRTCADHFRTWLRDRYGSLEAVNRRWVTAFWGHTYTAWDQIQPPTAIGEVSMQGLALDYRRFMSDMNLECYLGEAAILREVTPGVPVCTNFHGTRDMDYADWAPHQDVLPYDSYPRPEDSPAHTAFRFDYMRGLGGGASWLLMEQTPSQTQWQPYNPVRRPGQVRLHSLQAVAHGSDGAMFFQWRQSRGAAEMHHGAIVGHAGADNRAFREVAALGAELAGLDGSLRGGTVPARTAVIFEWPNAWALEFRPALSQELDAMEEALQWYSALWRANVGVDVIPARNSLEGYDLVVAPLLYVVTDEQAAAIEHFVEKGGTFITGFLSGVVDEDGRARLGGSPGALKRTLGIAVEEVDPMTFGQRNRVLPAEDDGTPAYACQRWQELVRLDGARALATFGDDDLAGSPAVTEHRLGKGRGMYVATHAEDRFLDQFLGVLLKDLGIAPPFRVPAAVEITQRVSGTSTLTFVLNHAGKTASFPIPRPMRDLLTGRHHDKRMELPASGVAVLVDA